MARERMVTRTIEEAVVDVMTVQVSTQKVENVTVKISATVGEKKALEYIQKTFDTADRKHVTIINYSVNEILYGMTEQDFIKYAKVLPPRSSNVEQE